MLKCDFNKVANNCFCSLLQPQLQNITVDPAFFCSNLIIFRANTVDCLRIAVSESPRQLAMAELIYCV